MSRKRAGDEYLEASFTGATCCSMVVSSNFSYGAVSHKMIHVKPERDFDPRLLLIKRKG